MRGTWSSRAAAWARRSVSSSSPAAPARRIALSGCVAAVAAGVATAFPSEAHARSAGGDGWYVKPWNSFQAAPETPDTVPGYERVHVFRRTNYTISLFTTLRDRATGTAAFTEASGKLAGLLLNEALALLPFTPTAVVTPVDGATYLGMRLPDPETEVCVVSVLRAADSISDVAMRMLPGVSVGKLLIQRDEKTAQPTLSYCKLPHDIASRKVLLVDPMLATGGSAVAAIHVLREAGVPEQAIVFACLVAAPEGIERVVKSHLMVRVIVGELDRRASAFLGIERVVKAHPMVRVIVGEIDRGRNAKKHIESIGIERVVKAHPMVRVIVGEVDRGLNAKKYIVPGLGDMGDRFYNTPSAPTPSSQ